MALIRPIVPTPSSDYVFFTYRMVTGGIGTSAYTNDNAIEFGFMPNGSTAFDVNNNDFSAHVGVVSFPLTVKKAGTYLINDGGTETTQTLSANDQVTVDVGTAHLWTIQKIG